MIVYGLPILYALFLWWFSTGAIFYLDTRPQHTFVWSMAGATVLMAGAVWGLTQTSTDVSLTGAYAGFTYGLVIWGWLEIGYYMGFMVGPRRQASPEGSSGLRRFWHATQTTLYHECAALALAALIAAVTWDMPNKVALWTFLVLWIMQISAKLNVFLGVPNLAESFLPAHLSFLRHFMTRKPMNLFFPVAITISMTVTTMFVGAAASSQASRFDAAGLTMISALLVLAILEHWFLVVPVPLDVLWRWSQGSPKSQASDEAAGSLVREGTPDKRATYKPTGQAFAAPVLTPSVSP